MAVIGDQDPFGEEPAFGDGKAGEIAKAKERRERIEAWAEEHGFAVVDSRIVGCIDAVDVEVPFYSITLATAVIHALPLSKVIGMLVLEPATFRHRALRFLHRQTRTTGDEGFDRAFHVEASDDALVMRLLDDRTRAAICECPIWCRVTFANDEITVVVDTPSMNGEALLAGMHITVAMARATARRNAYR